jgi:HlyD family secretion protein
VKKGESVTGNSFSIGTEIMTLADMSQLEIRSDVSENDIIKITLGDSADVIVDAYNNRKFRGVVKSIANSVRTTNSAMPGTGDITNYEVRILLDTASYRDLSEKRFPFRPGMNTSVEIRTRKEDNVLSVPIAAVNARVKDSDQSMEEKRKEEQTKQEEGFNTTETTGQLEEVVFVLQKDNTVKKQVVKTGIQDISYIQITEGINENDEVVTGPYSSVSRTLRNGMKVKKVTKDKLFEN